MKLQQKGKCTCTTMRSTLWIGSQFEIKIENNKFLTYRLQLFAIYSTFRHYLFTSNGELVLSNDGSFRFDLFYIQIVYGKRENQQFITQFHSNCQIKKKRIYFFSFYFFVLLFTLINPSFVTWAMSQSKLGKINRFQRVILK